MRRHALLLLVFLFLPAALASPASPGPVDPSMSSVDPVLVGDASGNAIGKGFEVVARHLDGVPADPGTVITLVFVGTGVAPYTAQAGGTTVDCIARTISKVVDSDGRAVFFPRMGGFNDGDAVKVLAGLMLLRYVPARSTDLNADGATDLADAQLFRAGFMANPPAAETDFNADGVTDLRDLAILRSELESGAKGSLCP